MIYYRDCQIILRETLYKEKAEKCDNSLIKLAKSLCTEEVSDTWQKYPLKHRNQFPTKSSKSGSTIHNLHLIPVFQLDRLWIEPKFWGSSIHKLPFILTFL